VGAGEVERGSVSGLFCRVLAVSLTLLYALATCLFSRIKGLAVAACGQ
jgi:hypothetical protein